MRIGGDDVQACPPLEPDTAGEFGDDLDMPVITVRPGVMDRGCMQVKIIRRVGQGLTDALEHV